MTPLTTTPVSALLGLTMVPFTSIVGEVIMAPFTGEVMANVNGEIVTHTLSLTDPPGPVTVMVYNVSWPGVTVMVPSSGTLPIP